MIFVTVGIGTDGGLRGDWCPACPVGAGIPIATRFADPIGLLDALEAEAQKTGKSESESIREAQRERLGSA